MRVGERLFVGSMVAALACGGSAPRAAGSAPRGPSRASDEARAAGEQGPDAQVLARRDLGRYHGWIKYLRFRARVAEERQGAVAARQAAERLQRWASDILARPDLLGELRGVHEWAYESEVDGSGQPFKLNIPTDYDPARPAAISLYMHGYSGNHLEHADYMVERPGSFELSVLGRSRGGRYVALSEADVFAALRYVQRHWVTDPDAVHLTGGSMGGGGAFWLGARHPDWFASARPVCGYASDKPLGNLLSLPIYATHSDDDYTVSILHVRGPMARLRAAGAAAVLDEATGFGHAVWNYAEGNRRADAWALPRRRTPSEAQRFIDYTALDRNATGAFWAHVARWGPQPRPARFVARAEPLGELRVQLRNVGRLRLRLDRSPLAGVTPLRILVAQSPLPEAGPAPPFEGAGAWSLSLSEAPAGGELELVIDPEGVRLAKPEPESALPSHTPGGANQLFDGSPLLIVYGSQGSSEERAAMRQAALVASQSSRARWQAPSGDAGPDGVSHNVNLYGPLRVEADHRVSEEEIRRSHLVLIGSETQNRLVQRFARELPAELRDGTLRFDDGLSIPARGQALGLVYYNPVAPGRLLFWVASEHPQAYRAGSAVARALGDGLSGADAAVASVDGYGTLRMTRSFGPDWRWLPRGDPPGPLLREGSFRGLALQEAEALRRAAGVPLAIADWPAGVEPTDPAVDTAQGRSADLLALDYYEPVQIFAVTGAELGLAGSRIAGHPLVLHPQPTPRQLESSQRYEVAISASAIRPFFSAVRMAPPSRDAGLTVAEALERHAALASPAAPH